MNKQPLDKLMHVLLVLSAITILLGALFKIQHYPYGSELVYLGLIANFGIASLEINRLKKIIKKLREEQRTEEKTEPKL